MMARGGGVSQAQLKREINSLSKEIFDTDLRIQTFSSQDNTVHILALEAAKIELQKQIVDCQIQLESKKALKENKHLVSIGGIAFLRLCTGKAIQWTA